MEREKRICLRSRDFDFIMYLSEYGIITNENVKLFYDSKYSFGFMLQIFKIFLLSPINIFI